MLLSFFTGLLSSFTPIARYSALVPVTYLALQLVHLCGAQLQHAGTTCLCAVLETTLATAFSLCSDGHAAVLFVGRGGGQRNRGELCAMLLYPML